MNMAPHDLVNQTYDRLRERRILFLRGALDAAAANQLAAELMALDAGSHDPVTVLVNSHGGELADAFPVIDTMRLVRAPVHTECIGQALGTAAVVLALGTGSRRARPNAAISLRSTSRTSIGGRASEIASAVEHLESMRSRVVRLVADASGQAADLIEDELECGGVMTAEAAASFGLVDAFG